MPELEIEDHTRDTEDLDKDGDKIEAQETAIAESKESLEKEARQKFDGGKHNRALEVAAKLDRKAAIKFEAKWCTKCKDMDRDTWSDKDVSEYMKENNVFMGINVDKFPQLKEKYGIGNKLPISLIGDVEEVTDENRESLKEAPQTKIGDTTYAFIVTSKIEGYMNAEDMLKELKKK